MNAPYLLLLEDDSSKVFDQSLADDLLFTCTFVCFITSNSFSHKLVSDGLRSKPPNPPELPSKPPELFSKPPEFFSKRFASPLPFPLLRQSESFLQRGSIKIVEKLFRNFKHWLFYVGPPQENIIFDLIYGLYFSHQHTYYKLQSFTNGWFKVGSNL